MTSEILTMSETMSEIISEDVSGVLSRVLSMCIPVSIMFIIVRKIIPFLFSRSGDSHHTTIYMASESDDDESGKKSDIELQDEESSFIKIKYKESLNSRDIPLRCPNCWGIPDNSGVCQYCGSRLV